MGKNTQISWAKHTFNPVIGCEKVSPGCDNCYAEAHWDTRFGNKQWDRGTPRHVTSESTWRNPVTWNKKEKAAGTRARVFCGSMCDVFDKAIEDKTRNRLWSLIRDTPYLDWLLLTKRAPNFSKYLPPDWGNGYENVWLGVSVENPKHGYPRIKHLQNIPAKVRFLSVEPLLEPVPAMPLDGIDWVIVGGESGKDCRGMDPAWAEDLRHQCIETRTAFYFKQLGGKGADKGGALLNGRSYFSVPTPSLIPLVEV